MTERRTISTNPDRRSRRRASPCRSLICRLVAPLYRVLPSPLGTARAAALIPPTPRRRPARRQPTFRRSQRRECQPETDGSRTLDARPVALARQALVKFCAHLSIWRYRPAVDGANGALMHFYSTITTGRVASQHGRRHKSGSFRGFPLSHRAAIAAILTPAKAAADLRLPALNLLLLTVFLIPLSRAVWMPAT